MGIYLASVAKARQWYLLSGLAQTAVGYHSRRLGIQTILIWSQINEAE